MTRASAPFHLLAKPAGAACNLGCAYCFFLSKENLYRGDSHLMDDATLERYIRQLLEASSGPQVEVAWQGGEPMLRGLPFYRRAVELVEKYRTPGQDVLHTIQTNGTLIDDDWAAFLKQNGFLVGISIDGPPALHDRFRTDHKGRGSFEAVRRGWDLLQEHGVDTNILCTIHTGNQDHASEIYRFFRDDLGARYIQFIPIVERATEATIETANSSRGGLRGRDRPLYRQEGRLVTNRSVSPGRFGAFLIEVFDEWIAADVGTVFVTTFDVALGSWLGQHNSCLVAPVCGGSLAMEHNGDVYACDHYVEPDHLVGNIADKHLGALVESERQRRFGQAKYDTLPAYCRECPVLFACYGECPRNRFVTTPDGEDGLNYLCSGYKAFFTHVDAPMKRMAELVRKGRPAASVMEPKPGTGQPRPDGFRRG